MSSLSNPRNSGRSFRDREVSAGSLLDIVVAASLAFGAVAGIAAWRMRAQSQFDRMALHVCVAREAGFVESARRLAGAAGISTEAVREEIERAVCTIAPALDVRLIFEEHDAQLVCIAAFGKRVEFFAGTRLAIDDDASLISMALRSGHRVTAPDAPLARRLLSGDTFAAAIPLVLDAGRRCVLYLASGSVEVAASIDRIVQIVDQAAPAYRLALERADDRARAEYDGLTGLLTPRAFRVSLALLVERARFAPLGRVSVLFIDTDRFKQWNDTYGHASGDALLRELAQLLRAAATEPGDFVARNGGDEFCIVLAGTEKSRAVERAERLRASIADADFGLLRGLGSVNEEVKISASIGVACFPVDAQSPNALLEKADEAMYYSKKTGRDGVSFFGVDGVLARANAGDASRRIERRRE